MNREVVITGMGVVSPNGIGIEDFWKNISGGVSVSHTLEKIERRGYGSIQGCEINGFSLDDYLKDEVQNGRFCRKAYAKLKNADRSVQMAVLATNMALKDSGLEYDSENNNIGIYLGNAEEAIVSQERITQEIIQRVMRKTFERFNPFARAFHLVKLEREFKQYMDLMSPDKLEEFIDMLSKNYGNIHEFTAPEVIGFKSYALPGNVSGLFHLHGPSMAINTACSSGLDAVGQAYRAIALGGLDVMIAGGSEAPITLQAVSAMDNLGVLSKTKPKPFCIDRDGFAISEGAGVLVIEEKEHAKKRGANIYAEVRGYGQSIDGNSHLCSIHPEGKYLQVALETALREAKLNPEEIDYINAHGTATKDCERVETATIKSVFGKYAYDVNVSSTKSMTGHSIGAIGGIETIITALSIREGVVPPTINLDNPDPMCDLNNTPNCAVQRKVRNAVSMSMGFGGYNGALVLGGNRG